MRASLVAPNVIGLLSRLAVNRATRRNGQGFPFVKSEGMPKLCQEDLLEILIDAVGQAGVGLSIVRCHRFSRCYFSLLRQT